MKIKTSELKGAALDWTVAKCEGIPEEELYISGKRRWQSLFRRTRDEEGCLDGGYITGPDLLFSTKWSAGGLIIEREGISLRSYIDTPWEAYNESENGTDIFTNGVTPLEAAMRCYVASKMGDEVNVPEELI